MNMRRLPFVMLLSVSALAVACGDPPPAENPPQPTVTATADPAPPAVTAEPTAAVTAPPTATAVAEPTPPPKPAKEKIVGAWGFSFEGDVKAKHEEELKKKYAKEKDTKKLDEAMKKLADEAAGEWVEFKDGYYISHVTEKGKDKVILKVKYEVVKEEADSITMKPAGKAETGKIDEKIEVTIKLVDDNTIEMPDPKKGKLIFKRKAS